MNCHTTPSILNAYRTIFDTHMMLTRISMLKYKYVITPSEWEPDFVLLNQNLTACMPGYIYTLNT